MTRPASYNNLHSIGPENITGQLRHLKKKIKLTRLGRTINMNKHQTEYPRAKSRMVWTEDNMHTTECWRIEEGGD